MTTLRLFLVKLPDISNFEQLSTHVLSSAQKKTTYCCAYCVKWIKTTDIFYNLLEYVGSMKHVKSDQTKHHYPWVCAHVTKLM